MEPAVETVADHESATLSELRGRLDEVEQILDTATDGIVIVNAGWLPEGFNLARVPGGVSGLGLVRALLPRRSAALAIAQQGEQVHTSVRLDPPSITRLDSA